MFNVDNCSLWKKRLNMWSAVLRTDGLKLRERWDRLLKSGQGFFKACTVIGKLKYSPLLPTPPSLTFPEFGRIALNLVSDIHRRSYRWNCEIVWRIVDQGRKIELLPCKTHFWFLLSDCWYAVTKILLQVKLGLLQITNSYSKVWLSLTWPEHKRHHLTIGCCSTYSLDM